MRTPRVFLKTELKANSIIELDQNISDHRPVAVKSIFSFEQNYDLNGDGNINENDLIDTLVQRPTSMDLILTGPSIPSRVIEMADQVTELRSGH